jgi:sialate O-acetylesterase
MQVGTMIRISILSTLLLLTPQLCQAELKVSPVFGDSMVVQRNKPIHVWGWTTPSADVSVELADKKGEAKSDNRGRFDVTIDPLPAGGPHQMKIIADETKTFSDVLVGEVWVCSGQSNMAWTVSNANDPDLESLSANFPNIRLISVPQVASQQPLNDFDGRWEACTPETVKSFSAVGYFFGRQLHQTIDVPIGLIDNAWGGSAAEAWIERGDMEKAGQYSELLKKWDDLASTYDHEAAMAAWTERTKAWEVSKKGQRPRRPRNQLTGNQRPANLYNGVLHPVLGYTIAGTIWYQGESNAGRAYQYRDLFPLMIQTWRERWGQGEFPFYWVQLADFQAEVAEPADSTWAELREAQTMTMSKLANAGEAVIIDLGEASDIHPRDKQNVGKRLARWALANQYNYEIPYQSPTYKSVEFRDGKAIIKFEHVGRTLDTFDVRQPIGFAIAGEDKKFVNANAKIVGNDTIEVWSDQVSEPAAVRYAWANNPVCNVQSIDGLPMTPFRTDQWPGVTEGKVK